MNNSDSNKPNYDHLLWLAGGAMAGAWWVKNRVEESKKSRAERDDPDGVQEVCEEIAEVLDEWEADEECQSEDDFTYNLAGHLEGSTDWEIEIMPSTPYGKPDILVGDLLVLELKVNPNKAERDRVVGQSAGYSRQWVTWVVLVDASASRVGQLEYLLADKGLERILVWNFS